MLYSGRARIVGLLVFLLATVNPGWAAVVRLVADSPGQYRVEGEDLDGVASIYLLITYDPTTLQLSSVTQGAMLQEMVFAGNPNQPGRVRIGAVGTQAISGSGILARLSGTVEKFPTVILGLTAKLSDSSGRPLPVQIQYPETSPIENQTQVETSPSRDIADTSFPSSTSQSRSGLISVGKVDLPVPWGSSETVSPPVSERLEPYVALTPGQDPRRRKKINEVLRKTERPYTPYTEKKQVRISSILEIFETYEGSRTLVKMALLFKRDTLGLQQRPEILLADGETPVVIEFPAKGDKEPSIALKNARLLWAGSVGEGRFLVRCIPEKGALSAKILFLGSKEMMKVPLTVVPSVLLAGIEVKKEEPLPKLDLDGDGEKNWRDDYILVANLLVQLEADKNEGVSAKMGQ